MPRYAFAVPFLPHQQQTWVSTADAVLSRHASEHRQFLLDRGIFKERWWMQTGEGTPPLSLLLVDCDDIERLFSPPAHPVTPHERWLADEIASAVHGVSSLSAFTPPTTELLSGTTTMATATAGTQTMFALPLPSEAMGPVRGLIERIEQGDLAQTHGRFLGDASIREEWIWLQHPHEGCPALLLIHWIGDDLDAAWQRLTFVRDDQYARVLHEALFTRLVGIAPEEVAAWQVEQLLAMHVRRSDGREGNQERRARRLFTAVAKGATRSAAELLSPDATFTAADGTSARGRDEVIAALDRLGVGPDGAGSSLRDVMAGQAHVTAVLGRADSAGASADRRMDGRAVVLLATVEGHRLVDIVQMTHPQDAPRR